jgi:hypothetical protein
LKTPSPRGNKSTIMKTNITRAILCLACFMLFYTACKKNTVKPVATTTTTVDYGKLSSQTAVAFYKSITGQYGGADVSKGIKSPFSTKAARRALFSTAPLCGFVIDTSYNYTIDTGPDIHSLTDTLKTYSGTFRFQYTCTGGNVNGYILNDTVGYGEQNAFTFSNSTNVTQNYTVKALDQTFKLVSMDGTLNSVAAFVQTFNEQGTYLRAAYLLTGLRVNFASGVADVTGGTATFHIVYQPWRFIGFPPTPQTYDGSIQFLGNHKAKLTINPGHVYLVDLLTGVVTAV